LVEPVEVLDLMLDIFLVLGDAAVRVDLHPDDPRLQLGDPEAVEVLLEDVREGGLGVGGEAQRALPEVLREVVRERGGRRRLSEAALAGEDNDLRDAAALLEEAREA